MTGWREIKENIWGLNHVGLVVRDLDKTVEYYRSLGIGTLVADRPRLSEADVAPLEILMYGKRVPSFSKSEILRVGPLDVEVVEPPAIASGVSVNRDFLDSKGEGVSHICFEVPDIEGETARLVEKGTQVILSVTRQGRLVENYLDTRECGGIFISLRSPARESTAAAEPARKESGWELFHLGLVVRDLDRTLEYYQSLGLVSAFYEYPEGYTPPTFEIPGMARNIRDSSDLPTKGRFRARQLRMGPLPLEVLQLPGGGRDANSEFLDRRGEGIPHMGFFVDDLEGETARLVEKGIQVLLVERRDDRITMRYFDTREFGGIVLELKQKGTI